MSTITTPTRLMQRKDDQIVPIADAGLRSAKLIEGARLKVSAGCPHGMSTTDATVINPE